MKKKLITLGVTFAIGASVLAGCGASTGGDSTQTTSAEATTENSINLNDLITIQINTEGLGGQIAYANKGEELKFDEDIPFQSAVANVEKGSELTISAKAEEGYKFRKWTKNGEDFSKEAQVDIKADEDAEYIAVFGPAGTNEAHVDLASVKTMGEVMGLPDYGNACTENKFVYVFEQDDNFYRAIANVTREDFEAVAALDIADADYAKKLADTVSALEVEKIENLTEAIPSQEELDKLKGKTGEELLNDGWSDEGWDLDAMTFYMTHGLFSYIVEFEGDVDNADSFEIDKIKPFTVKSVKYRGLGDASNPDIPLK